MHTSTRAAGIVAGLSMTLGSLGALAVAPAHAAEPVPCAKEQQKVDKATAALERVTTVFEAQKDKVAEAKAEVAAADSAGERGQARKDLARAKADKSDSRTVKKAQVQRLTKAQERLDSCLAPETTTS